MQGDGMAVIARCWIGQTFAGPVLVTDDQVEDYRQQHFRVDGPYVLEPSTTRGAVEALREIVAHSEMPAGEPWPTAYSEVVFMARDALDRLGGQ